MAGLGDEIAAGAAGRGRLRASHADREQAIDMLKAAFVQGRLDRDEFDLRVGRALASPTYADLAALTADIPPWLTGVAPPGSARKPADRQAVTAVACVSVAWVSIWIPLAIVDKMGSLVNLVLVVALICVVPALLGGVLLVDAWRDKRAGRQSSQGPPPGDGGGASRYLALSASAGQLRRGVGWPRSAGHAGPPQVPGPPTAPTRQYGAPWALYLAQSA